MTSNEVERRTDELFRDFLDLACEVAFHLSVEDRYAFTCRLAKEVERAAGKMREGEGTAVVIN